MTDPLPDLDLEWCRTRQQRVRTVLRQHDVARALLTRPEQVQYLTGYRPHPLQSAAVVLDGDECLLVAPNQEPDRHAAGVVLPFEAQWLCTLRQDQEAAIGRLLRQHFSGKPERRLAVEGSRCNSLLAAALGAEQAKDLIDIEPALLRLRRRKDPDELIMLRHAIAATAAMYAKARQIIRPGVTELEVFIALQSAAVNALGEPLTATGNDYRCNAPGGSPRARPAEAGELFILDLGPAYRGYFADNCRTIAVDGRPTEAQSAAHEVVMSVLAEVERVVRPGLRCRDLFAEAKARLDAWQEGAFFHHLGHGIGLYPHEMPHLNPAWDDVFEEGDVFTAEPGLYADPLRAGLRIEENYLVTASGVEKLTCFTTDL